MNPLDVKADTAYDAPVQKVWEALTDNEQLKQWYFKLPEFRAEIGFEFQFYGGKKADKQYLHLCKVTEVDAGKKLAYSWRFDGYSGISTVTFELFDIGKVTILKLRHSGLESFLPVNADFAKEEFEIGWTQFLNVELKKYLEKQAH